SEPPIGTYRSLEPKGTDCAIRGHRRLEIRAYGTGLANVPNAIPSGAPRKTRYWSILARRPRLSDISLRCRMRLSAAARDCDERILNRLYWFIRGSLLWCRWISRLTRGGSPS